MSDASSRVPTPQPIAGSPKSDQVRSMFNDIAGNYDLANTVMSAGVHHLWRKSLVVWSEAIRGQRVLDCATGTGDLAIAFKDVVGAEGTVVGTDFSPGMLAPAPAKAAKRGMSIQFEQADVTQLPYADASFDIASISFGIRNVENPLKGLSELARVVRPGGLVMVLEFGQPRLPGFRQVYNFYSKHLLPKVGGWVTGRRQAYEYLQDSSAQFPCREGFVDLMNETGRFARVDYRPVSFGIAYLYKGRVK
jgi:demethylmenaquinone methyltransferase/2-methoxy-6-polyprenyl-1,4-benzoquinol methylase